VVEPTAAWIVLTTTDVQALVDWHRAAFLGDVVYSLLDSELIDRITALLPM